MTELGRGHGAQGDPATTVTRKHPSETPASDTDLFPGKSDDEVAALARGFVLDEHCMERDGDDELPEPLGYEP